MPHHQAAHLGRLEQARRWRRQYQLALVEDPGVVGLGQGETGVLLGDQNGGAVGLQVAEGGGDVAEHARRQAQRGFIQNQQPRTAGERSTDRQHLLLAAGQPPGGGLQARHQGRKQVENHLPPPAPGGGRATAGGGQGFGHRHGRKQSPPLGAKAESKARPAIGRHVGDVGPRETDLAGGERPQPHDHTQ
ncbi:MAG: hypothetical protein VX345_02875 [Pseudomonadota bacterium]|nr:hypothetical protein [Pseudomonadota bacterium]